MKSHLLISHMNWLTLQRQIIAIGMIIFLSLVIMVNVHATSTTLSKISFAEVLEQPSKRVARCLIVWLSNGNQALYCLYGHKASGKALKLTTRDNDTGSVVSKSYDFSSITFDKGTIEENIKGWLRFVKITLPKELIKVIATTVVSEQWDENSTMPQNLKDYFNPNKGFLHFNLPIQTLKSINTNKNKELVRFAWLVHGYLRGHLNEQNKIDHLTQQIRKLEQEQNQDNSVLVEKLDKISGEIKIQSPGLSDKLILLGILICLICLLLIFARIFKTTKIIKTTKDIIQDVKSVVVKQESELSTAKGIIQDVKSVVVKQESELSTAISTQFDKHFDTSWKNKVVEIGKILFGKSTIPLKSNQIVAEVKNLKKSLLELVAQVGINDSTVVDENTAIKDILKQLSTTICDINERLVKITDSNSARSIYAATIQIQDSFKKLNDQIALFESVQPSFDKLLKPHTTDKIYSECNKDHTEYSKQMELHIRRIRKQQIVSRTILRMVEKISSKSLPNHHLKMIKEKPWVNSEKHWSINLHSLLKEIFEKSYIAWEIDENWQTISCGKPLSADNIHQYFTLVDKVFNRFPATGKLYHSIDDKFEQLFKVFDSDKEDKRKLLEAVSEVLRVFYSPELSKSIDSIDDNLKQAVSHVLESQKQKNQANEKRLNEYQEALDKLSEYHHWPICEPLSSVDNIIRHEGVWFWIRPFFIERMTTCRTIVDQIKKTNQELEKLLEAIEIDKIINEYDSRLCRDYFDSTFNLLAGGWLHKLFRAHDVLQTYYLDNKALKPLSKHLWCMNMILRILFGKFLNIEFQSVKLLKNIPASYDVDNMEVQSNLTELVEVKKRVKAVIKEREKNKQDKNFVVDVSQYHIIDPGNASVKATMKLVKYNTDQWSERRVGRKPTKSQ